MWIFSLWVPKIPSDLLCPATLILPHPTLHVIFFLAKATKQRSVIDKTVAKLKTKLSLPPGLRVGLGICGV